MFSTILLQQLGKPLRAQARTQLNVAMTRVDGINAARGLRDIIFPMVWWADGIDGIDDEDSLALLRSLLKYSFVLLENCMLDGSNPPNTKLQNISKSC